jgi:hemerythrin
MTQDNEQNYISWNPSFEIGIPLIDEQHKKLVSLCNKVYLSLLKSRKNGNELIWESSLVEALHECTAYVRTHLAEEEQLMKAAGYKDFISHKKMHETFIQKILEMDNKFETVTIGDTIVFVKFLYEWIIQHIAYVDKQYVKSVALYLSDLNKKNSVLK